MYRLSGCLFAFLISLLPTLSFTLVNPAKKMIHDLATYLLKTILSKTSSWAIGVIIDIYQIFISMGIISKNYNVHYSIHVLQIMPTLRKRHIFFSIFYDIF